MKMKKCTSCGKRMANSQKNFYKDTRRPGGLRSMCKKCTALRRKRN